MSRFGAGQALFSSQEIFLEIRKGWERAEDCTLLHPAPSRCPTSDRTARMLQALRALRVQHAPTAAQKGNVDLLAPRPGNGCLRPWRRGRDGLARRNRRRPRFARAENRRDGWGLDGRLLRGWRNVAGQSRPSPPRLLKPCLMAPVLPRCALCHCGISPKTNPEFTTRAWSFRFADGRAPALKTFGSNEPRGPVQHPMLHTTP